ncbi:diacylglycerol/lipid kinase family protein [Gemmatimonas sp.]|uniref:diacylglycerol/lipid kinase family protein n=1 Tax=Gemmatimonas sp. TaxID=1962908 RepID=UPI0039833084
MTAPIVLLVNPVAGRGRAIRVARAALDALGATGVRVELRETRERGDEARIARDASASGARALAVVGGDGAVSHAARGLLDGEARGGARVPLAIFAAGTGNDFVKSLQLPVHDVHAMARHTVAGVTRDVDVGYVDDVPFVNAAGFGFDVEVLRRMGTPGLLRGTAAYVGTALGALLRYRGFHARVTSATRHNTTHATAHHLMIVLANGRYFGGAFHIAPDARLDDGAIDCISIRDVSPLARLSLFAQAIRGRHLASPMVQSRRDRSFHLHFETPPPFEADGELQMASTRDVIVRVAPSALRIISATSREITAATAVPAVRT